MVNIVGQSYIPFCGESLHFGEQNALVDFSSNTNKSLIDLKDRHKIGVLPN